MGPYWEGRLGKSSFHAYQASERGGDICVEVQGDRVQLGGKAVTVYPRRTAVSEAAVDAFRLLDLRVGRITRAELNAAARKPAYCLWVDFGAMGQRTSSAQLTAVYQIDELVGRHVIAAVNLGSRRIAGFISEVLVLGVPNEAGQVVLLQPERSVPLGGRVY